ncbi:hypothetical protein DY000_02039313 [Brassica cretica]|uniref:Uncharacterized protein n=1 Tax=Brassica cretica TaxID=69181 RepID=A0ABQ7BB26_BRACR|nr:hypothetical protein DY000_02039313 [Brassica cretica]
MSIPRPRLSMDCSSEAKSTTSEEEDDVGAVSRDETGLILALVILRFLDVRIHPKDATANPESRRRRSRGSRRERRGFAPVFLWEGDQKVDDFTRLRSPRGEGRWCCFSLNPPVKLFGTARTSFQVHETRLSRCVKNVEKNDQNRLDAIDRYINSSEIPHELINTRNGNEAFS